MQNRVKLVVRTLAEPQALGSSPGVPPASPKSLSVSWSLFPHLLSGDSTPEYATGSCRKCQGALRMRKPGLFPSVIIRRQGRKCWFL